MRYSWERMRESDPSLVPKSEQMWVLCWMRKALWTGWNTPQLGTSTLTAWRATAGLAHNAADHCAIHGATKSANPWAAGDRPRFAERYRQTVRMASGSTTRRMTSPK